MTDMIKCPDCGLIIAPDKMKMHKAGECTLKQYSDIFRRNEND